MPRMTVEVRSRSGAPFSVGRSTVRNPIELRVKKFVAEERKARAAAAQTATEASRRAFRYLRGVTEPRPGRSSTGGRLMTFVRWRPLASGGVGLALSELDENAPHWIIHEIGTNERAEMRVAGENERVIVRTVPSQRGRIISQGLVFASGPGGRYTPPGQAQGQQLQLASRVTGVPRTRGDLKISEEIRGQHFVRRGGQAGFRQYSDTVLSAARSTFRKSAGL